MTKLSPLAINHGRKIARAMFAGRTGHGGGPCLKRNLNEAEIAALVGLAYDAGRNEALGRVLGDRELARYPYHNELTRSDAANNARSECERRKGLGEKVQWRVVDRDSERPAYVVELLG